MIKNQIKTTLLLGLLTGLFLFIGSILGGKAGLIIGLIFAGIMNVGSFWFSDKIVLKMYRAQEADRSKHSKLYDMVKDITVRAKLPMPKVYIIPGPHPNAFATGRSPNHAAIACTVGIINLLTDHELKGVIAHELAHVKNRDTLISTVSATIAGVISYIAMMARWSAIFGGFGGNRDNNNIIELIVLAIIAPLMAMIIQMAISRSREYLADETGARFLNDATGLASALEKIEQGIKHVPLRPMGQTEATAHLFIQNPFRNKGIVKLFSTHPSTKDRIKKLHSLKF